MKSVFSTIIRLQVHFTKKNSAENEKSRAELLFLIVSAMFWHQSHLWSLKPDWVLLFLMNLFMENLKRWRTPSKFWQSEPLNTYFTYTPSILRGFSCLQAHNLLKCDHPDPKDNFSPIKKKRHLTHFDATAPLIEYHIHSNKISSLSKVVIIQLHTNELARSIHKNQIQN